jgi:hypothetical protein
MSKLQSKDFLNISCIVEGDPLYDSLMKSGEDIGYYKGKRDAENAANAVLKKHKKTARVGTGLGALISGGIGYYLGKKLNNNNAAQSLHNKLADNEDTHSLHDILNHHHES